MQLTHGTELSQKTHLFSFSRRLVAGDLSTNENKIGFFHVRVSFLGALTSLAALSEQRLTKKRRKQLPHLPDWKSSLWEH